MEKENEDKALKSQIVWRRCAKAAFLLSQLNSLPTLPLQDNAINHPNEMMWRKEIEDLKMELVKERFKFKKIKLCSLLEFVVQIVLLLSLWTFFLMFALKTR